MEFCKDCENILVLKFKNTESEGEKLQLYCNNCGFNKNAMVDKCSYILKNDYNLQKVFIEEKNIKYITQDPTIPHISNIKCPNKQCIKVDEEINNVAYIKINEQDMKYLYVCSYCKYQWTNSLE